MSKLEALQGKSQVFNIGGVELELKPLTVDELSLFSIDDKAPMEEQMKSTKTLISKVLKNSVPDATDEEINNISLEHLQDMMDAIMKLHKFEGDSKLQKVKDAIKARQSQGKTATERQ
ncbi:hypothetical protein LCGC14_1554100 [marine sediment metagenome]|uniref:Uncharacterized protein n=1 Tax=marine sediment metagenome TaxID=412755 RepID=A0A0F9IPG0_9ZZZZ